MPESQPKSDFFKELAAEAEKPLTLKDRLIGLVIIAAFSALGAAIFLWPDLVSIKASDFSGRGGRKIATILNWIWSYPVAVIALLLAAIMLWGTLTKKGPGKEKLTEQKPTS